MRYKPLSPIARPHELQARALSLIEHLRAVESDIDPIAQGNLEHAKGMLFVIKATLDTEPHKLALLQSLASLLNGVADLLEGYSLTEDEPSNTQRAAWAHEALAVFTQRVWHGATPESLSRGDLEDAVADLVSNLLHYAAINGVDPCAAHTGALDNFNSETGGAYGRSLGLTV